MNRKKQLFKWGVTSNYVDNSFKLTVILRIFMEVQQILVHRTGQINLVLKLEIYNILPLTDLNLGIKPYQNSATEIRDKIQIIPSQPNYKLSDLQGFQPYRLGYVFILNHFNRKEMNKYEINYFNKRFLNSKQKKSNYCKTFYSLFY